MALSTVLILCGSVSGYLSLICNEVSPSHAPKIYYAGSYEYTARAKTRPDPIGVIVVATISARLSTLPFCWLWEPVCIAMIRTITFPWTIVRGEDTF